ncbi:MAG: PEP/pyruvate-binding domain-containing protein, partial [Aeromicrobium sp.]
VAEAVSQVQASAFDPSALTYREQRGLAGTPRMGVVIQRMVGAEVAGVLFTRNTVTGENERVIEASWGLGETVVAGLVTPDQYRLGADGRVLQRSGGEKDMALVLGDDGRTREVPVIGDRVEALCLDDANLRSLHELAMACDRVFATSDHDIEFAFVGGMVHLLQRRPITHG